MGQLACLEGYGELLRTLVNRVEIDTCDSVEIKRIRVKAARHVSYQLKKSGRIPKDATFDTFIVDMSDIADDGKYYVGLLFVPSTCEHV